MARWRACQETVCRQAAACSQGHNPTAESTRYLPSKRLVRYKLRTHNTDCLYAVMPAASKPVPTPAASARTPANADGHRHRWAWQALMQLQ